MPLHTTREKPCAGRLKHATALQRLVASIWETTHLSSRNTNDPIAQPAHQVPPHCLKVKPCAGLLPRASHQQLPNVTAAAVTCIAGSLSQLLLLSALECNFPGSGPGFPPQMLHQRPARCIKLMGRSSVAPATGCSSELPTTCTKIELPAPSAECACTGSTIGLDP